MRLLLFALLLLTLLRTATAANSDPMEWTPPATVPNLVELVKLDAKAMSEALERADAIYKIRSLKPELGLEVTNLVPNGPAMELGIKPGDILTALDGTPLLSANLFNNFREEKLQKLTISDSANVSRTVEIAPGKIGAILRPFDRDNPLALSGNLNDPRWKDEIFVAEMLCESDPKLAASALAHAVSKGMERTPAVNLELARLYLDAFDYDDAMNFAHWAIKENVGDDAAARLFAQAARANYKIEAFRNILKGNPTYRAKFTEEMDAALENLISQHKARPDAERLVVSPREAMKSFFLDDLSTRAESIPRASNWNEAQQKGHQRLSDYVLRWQRININMPQGKAYYMGFTPAVKNIYVKAVINVRPTDHGMFSQALFRLGVYPLDRNIDFRIEDQAYFERGFSISSQQDCSPFLVINHPSVVLNKEIISESPQLCKQLNDPSADTSLEIIAVNGDVEMLVNGNRMFYGPLGQSDPKLFAALMHGGEHGRLRRFQVYELLTPVERDEQVKPNINRPYRHNRTRIYSAALHGTKAQIRELLQMGANLDIKDDYGLTPLHAAILEFGDFEELLAQGAKADLHALCGMNDVPKALAAIAAAPPPPGSEQISPLHFAATTDNIEVAKKILEKGYKIDALSSIVYVQATPLHWAAFHGRQRMAEFLLQNGADPNAKAEGYTPIQEARDSGFDSLAKILEEWSAGKRTGKK